MLGVGKKMIYLGVRIHFLGVRKKFSWGTKEFVSYKIQQFLQNRIK